MVTCILSQQTQAQQTPVAITDSLPLESNGFKMGYIVLNTTEKEVGDKGNFSRYQLQFYVTNTTTEPKITWYRQGFNLPDNDPSPLLARFNCINATGARLTTKEAQVQAKACYVMAKVDDKDCSNGKTAQNKRQVQIGYWIKPGETIAAKAIVIVPLNQQPDIKVTLLYNNIN